MSSIYSILLLFILDFSFDFDLRKDDLFSEEEENEIMSIRNKSKK